MRLRKALLVSLSLIVILLTPLLVSCAEQTEVSVIDGYTAVLPAVLRAGSTQSVSVSLFNAEKPASGNVQLALLKDGNQVAGTSANVKGNGTLQLNVPTVAEGACTIRLSGTGFSDEASVQVQSSSLVFMETDKPIYKPGQTIHMRVISLTPELKPVSENVTVDVMDSKGSKVFRQSKTTDEYGTITLDLPLSTEPNLGTWKITASGAKAKTEVDVRVEEYVLPKYEISVDLPRDWCLVNEEIKGKVSATYSFGKPVQGDLEIKASRYVGTWQDFATLDKPIDSQADFTVPAVGYVAGVPASGGQGNVMLTVKVTEKSTGYVETTTRLLTVSQSSIVVQVIPSGSSFKPGIPFSFLLLTETPDNKLVDGSVKAHVSYTSKDFKEITSFDSTVSTARGKALMQVTPPADAVAMTITASSQGASAISAIGAGYSPSGNFIHVEQATEGAVSVGQDISFKVYSTQEAANFYYEVVSRGMVVFSQVTKGNMITFEATPAMAPGAKLLVYQILPNAEVAADYLPFDVNAQFAESVKVDFSTSQAKPGDSVSINVQTDGQAKVGLVAVDKSVYILAEDRLNLQQVFDELEKLYMQPQAEIHDVLPIYQSSLTTQGAQDIFKSAGVVILSNKTVPAGQSFKNTINPPRVWAPGVDVAGGVVNGAKGVTTTVTMTQAQTTAVQGLAEVQRIRQFFPETWLWQEVVTNASGKATVNVTVPDTITTWMLQAVALSKANGMGIAESQLKAFQPFFLSVDLPYLAIRGEEFPVKVAVYNYLDTTQSVTVQLKPAAWFELVGGSDKTVDIKANDIGNVVFTIKPLKIGVNDLEVAARSKQAADAVVKQVLVEAEGVSRELTDNLVLSNGASKTLDTSFPTDIVDGSARAYLTVTSSFLAQTISGLDSLLQMPMGCGEQNMMLFAPDLYITKYLKESGQLKPEVMAKAEKLMITGYQRELTYRHSDGSFSAFGMQDKEGSLWLTAFVLKNFAQARDLMYIDQSVLDSAQSWIKSHQNTDGSFDQVGLVIHQELLGGLKGKTALTAYVALALLQSGEQAAAGKAVGYLETKLGDMADDPYALALTANVLELAKSPKAADACNMLMKLAKQDDNGLYWGSDAIQTETAPTAQAGIMRMPVRQTTSTSQIETTGYALQALVQQGDVVNAGKAAKWLVSKRNAYGGFGSTQDTVVGLEALTKYATGMKSDVDLTVTIGTGSSAKQIRVRPDNFDVLQIVELPANTEVAVKAEGKGDVIAQVVRRFNVPQVETQKQALDITVDYNASQVAENDLVKVSVQLQFNPPEPIEAGMIVADISVPTGFSAVTDSIAVAVKAQPKIKRYDISGRKVIFYVENMMPGDKLSFSFDVQAMYPVKAKGVVSKAYSYYNPELSGETLGHDMVVVAK